MLYGTIAFVMLLSAMRRKTTLIWLCAVATDLALRRTTKGNHAMRLSQPFPHLALTRPRLFSNVFFNQQA
jgi:hypothetical protein